MLIPILSFAIVLFIMPYWIKRAKMEGLAGKDVHKMEKTVVAEGGGIVVLFAFTVGVLVYVGSQTITGTAKINTTLLFALLNTVFIATFAGFIDDILGWKRGLNYSIRILMIGFAAVPLMVIEAGQSIIFDVSIGIWYPLIVIPIAVVGATTTFNFIAGYNGLEAGMGIITLTGMGYACFHYQKIWLMMVCFIMVAALLGFLWFNKYPAKVFPGDSLTYAVGALCACIAIMANIEKLAITFFALYGVETVLKLRGKLKKESFANIEANGYLSLPYSSIYGLEHLVIKMIGQRATEKKVVFLLWVGQILIVMFGLYLFIN